MPDAFAGQLFSGNKNLNTVDTMNLLLIIEIQECKDNAKKRFGNYKSHMQLFPKKILLLPMKKFSLKQTMLGTKKDILHPIQQSGLKKNTLR